MRGAGELHHLIGHHRVGTPPKGDESRARPPPTAVGV
ncbi:hypothetical protein GZL_02511 [Streptomyces sp. 769]|nr:hypothetical protein GZL_02511 [Streptomyces sp. 769]